MTSLLRIIDPEIPETPTNFDVKSENFVEISKSERFAKFNMIRSICKENEIFETFPLDLR